MTPRMYVAILAAAALPALAQNPAPRTDAPVTATAQAKDAKARAEAPTSTRERAKAAKAQKKKSRQAVPQKPAESQKKAPTG